MVCGVWESVWCVGECVSGVWEGVCDYIYQTRPKKHLKMNKEVGMLLPKKDLIQVE